MPILPEDLRTAIAKNHALQRPSGELTSLRDILRNPQQKARVTPGQGSASTSGISSEGTLLATSHPVPAPKKSGGRISSPSLVEVNALGKQKKSLAERREQAQERTSFEILTNPPDKFSNGDAIGFTPYFTTQFGLPHSAIKGNLWQRRNGNETLSITTDCPYGLPSGSKPRLLLAWIATWQVRHPNHTVIDLGKNVSRFLEHELGVPRTGRYIKDVQLEMIRLFSATISVITNNPETKQYSRDAALISNKFDLWRTKSDDQDALFPSFVILSDEFRQSILERPIPFDLRGLSILTPSPLAMDYYVWFARVMFSLKTSRLVPWKALHDQFGSQYDWATKEGRYRFRAESAKQITKRIRLAYPTLRVSFPEDQDGIMLHPSPTPVPPISSKKIMLLRQS